MFDISSFSSVAFHVFGMPIRWYALAYITGFLLAPYYLTYLTTRFSNLKLADKFWDRFLTAAVIGIILGGRLGYVLFYNLSYFLDHPAQIFALWQGGMSFHGGGIGLGVAAYLFCRREKVSFVPVFDLLMCAAPIGLFFGRIANFINQELYGKMTDAWYGVRFHNEPFARHPSQLYEAFLEGFILFIVMYFLYQKKSFRDKPGRLTGVFFLGYGLSRALVEFVRLPDAQIGYLYSDWLTMGHILSLPMILFSGWLIFRNKKS